LKEVVLVCASVYAFAALRKDGTVVTWGVLLGMKELVDKGSFSVVYKATWRRQITVQPLLHFWRNPPPSPVSNTTTRESSNKGCF